MASIAYLSLLESILDVMHVLFQIVLDSSEYYRLHIVKLKIFYMYWVKASVMLFLLHWLWPLLLPDIMDQPPVTWWSLVPLLFLHCPAHHLEVVSLSASPTSFPIDRALSLGMPCSTVLSVFNSLLVSMCLISLSLCILSDGVKVHCLFHVV